jgi:adenine specific DNA methylase Mod
MNTLYFGDNLRIMRDSIESESVDLIYLDPPFKSGKNYNILFQPGDGSYKGATAQIQTFEDTWNWGEEAERTYFELLQGSITREPPNQKLIELIKSMRSYLGECSMMAYLSMMAPRLLEMRRVLKENGSIYLHCDPTASHYLKLLMDSIFGTKNFMNEIVWKRASAHNDPNKYGNIHDVIFFYTKTNNYIWNSQYTPYSQEYLNAEWKELPSGRRYKVENMLDPRQTMNEYDFMGTVARWRTNYKGMMEHWNAKKTEVPNSHGRIKLGKNGKPTKRCRIIFLDEMKGVPLQTWWDDIFSLRGGSKERMGYPTQKPESLLERIVKASSNKNDVILDPFCGCGTTVAVAQKLDRKWIGIDVTYLAIDVIIKRLEDSGLIEGKDFEIHGTPRDPYSAKKLTEDDPFQFQIWCTSKLNATPSERKTGDEGVDGIINFVDYSKKNKIGKGIIQVKGSVNVGPSEIRDLKGTLESQGADFAIFISFKDSTQGMTNEAVKTGYFVHEQSGRKIPKIQILTVEDLFKDPIPIKLPPTALSPYKKSPIRKKDSHQLEVDM